MLHSAALVVSEYGYGQMSVARVTGRARVSRRTFYDVFLDREDCFLAVFDETLAQVSERVLAAYEYEGDWRERVRGALSALLEFLDDEPGAGSLLIVDALGAGPRVLARRAEIVERLGAELQREGSRAHTGQAVPPLTGEGVIGAVLSVIHTRLSQQRQGPLVELVGPLMGMIVLPYLGAATARREIERPAPKASSAVRSRQTRKSAQAADPLDGLQMRITYRTLRVLSAIGERPGASNRDIAHAAGVSDQGQMSKLLTRLERLGLIHNTTGQDDRPTGEPNAWSLTPRGEEIELTIRLKPNRTEPETNGTEAP
jgi:AcrR family transcriptional regulator/DNA-binding MarR family transcriptional regulator